MFEWLSLYFASSFGILRKQGRLAPLDLFLLTTQRSKYVFTSAGKNVYKYGKLCPAFTILILTLAGGIYGTIYYQALATGSPVAGFAFRWHVFVDSCVTGWTWAGDIQSSSQRCWPC